MKYVHNRECGCDECHRPPPPDTWRDGVIPSEAQVWVQAMCAIVSQDDQRIDYNAKLADDVVREFRKRVDMYRTKPLPPPTDCPPAPRR
jgi:hypothetical protein